MTTALDQAQILMQANEFPEAFAICRSVAYDTNATTNDRADAFQMLGTIVQCTPTLGDTDECGLSYFKRALEIDPEHLWACLGIVTTFGKNFPDHQDVAAVKSALEKLLLRIDDVPASSRKTIADRSKLLETF